MQSESGQDVLWPADAASMSSLASSSFAASCWVPPLKEKRKQNTSCDACRLRRVKCIRDGGQEEACKSCRQRNLNCTKVYVSAKAQQQATSKRLGAAKALYGKHTIAPVSLNSAPSITLFAFDSAEARISDTQCQSSIGNDLVHLYRDMLVQQMPLSANFEAFLVRWEDAGRRHSQLVASDQATHAVVLALAARITNLPVIAGSDAPSPAVLKKGIELEGVDLASVGARRDPICRSIEDKARACVETTFMRKEASLESVAALYTMQAIDATCSAYKDHPRVYSATAIEHLRFLTLQGAASEQDRMAIEVLWRGLLSLDSAFNYESSRRSQISDEDLVECYPRAICFSATEILTQVMVAEENGAHTYIVDAVCSICRHIKKHFFNVIARAQAEPPTLSLFTLTRQDLNTMMLACDVGRSKTTGHHGINVILACRLGFALEYGLLWWQLSTWLERSPHLADMYASESRELLLGFADGLISMALRTEELFRGGYCLGNSLLWRTLAESIEHLLDLPLDQLPHISRDQIMWAVKSYLRCVRQLTFSWPDLGSTESVEELETKACLFELLGQ